MVAELTESQSAPTLVMLGVGGGSGDTASSGVSLGGGGGGGGGDEEMVEIPS